MDIDNSYSDEAEKSVLSAILQDNTIIEDCNLKPSDFFVDSNRMVYTQMRNMYSENRPIDVTTLSGRIQQLGRIDAVNGIDGIRALSRYVHGTKNVMSHIAAVKERALYRDFNNIVREMSFKSTDTEDIGNVIDETQQRLLELTEEANVKSPVSAAEAAKNYVETMKDRAVNGYHGTHIGYRGLDGVTGGFKKGELIVLAARPAMGKTALAMNMAQNVARNGVSLVFSLEMSEEQLMNRVFTSELFFREDRTNMMEVLKSGDANAYWRVLERAKGIVSKLRMHIYDDSKVTLIDIKRVARQVRHKEGRLDAIFIDYLQLMTSERHYDSRVQEVTELTRSLKILARELEVPIIILSQLSRGVEGRNDKRPMMSDLRESGSIEQDADIVLMLYREGYYNKEYPYPYETELIVAKHRGGPVGTHKLMFMEDTVTFLDVDPALEQSQKEEDDDDDDDNNSRWH